MVASMQVLSEKLEPAALVVEEGGSPPVEVRVALFVEEGGSPPVEDRVALFVEEGGAPPVEDRVALFVEEGGSPPVEDRVAVMVEERGLPFDAAGPVTERPIVHESIPSDLEGLLDDDDDETDDLNPLLAIPADEFLDVQLSSLDEVLTEFILAAVEDLRVRLGCGPRPRDLVEYLLGRSRDPHVAAGPGGGVFGRIPVGGVHAAIDRLLRLGAIGYERGSKRLCLLSGAAWVSQIWGETRPRLIEALFAAPRRTPLYEALANYRREAAREAEVPPYRVLTNRVLDAILQSRPRSLRDLAAIAGVGPVTLSTHGQAILALIRSAPPDPTTHDQT